MRNFTCFLPLALAAIVPASAAQFKIGAHNFTLPDGFEMELVAGTNLVPRPIEADFDEQGRLYVTDSSGSNDKVEKQLAEKPHRVVRLEDTDGDARFDTSVVFTDKMMFPEGCMWLDGSLYVAAPPSIWKLTDTNNDGVADVRVEWFQGKTLTGCANDLHGPYAGPDGWIYWCKGAFAKQTYTLPNGKQFETRASHIFRARPDGSGIEPVMTGGMDNPVGLAFTPEGERILSGTFFQNPEGGKRDGLIHAIYGGVYGKVNDVLEGHVRTGDLLPMMTHLGAAAPCGLARYESDAFGKPFQNNLFVCCFNMHKIVRSVLQPGGATYKTADSDFLVSDNTDFHPTDVFEDADGSLLVIDTGGWYKLCCPTSQLQKPDVLGGIYRVRRTGAPKVRDPRGLTINWSALTASELARKLGDSRPVVQKRAMEALARRGPEVVPAVKALIENESGFNARLNGIWTLARIQGEEAGSALRSRTEKFDVVMLNAAVLNALSTRRDSNALPLLMQETASPNLAQQRFAIEALGRIGDKTAVPALLKAAYPAGTERALEHAIIYALIEIGDRESTLAGLKSNEQWTQRVALMALEQMPGGRLNAEQVVPLLSTDRWLLREAALWVASRHPEWGEALTGFFHERLQQPNLSDDERVVLQRQLAKFSGNRAIQELIAGTLTAPETIRYNHWSALHAMLESGLKDLPAAWASALVRTLAGNDPRLVPVAISVARNSKVNSPELMAALLRIGGDSTQPRKVRLDALAATSARAILDSQTFEFLCMSLASTNPVSERASAASVLAKANLTSAQLGALADSLQSVGPLELPKLIAAFANGRDEQLGLKLVASLKSCAASSSLRPEVVRPALTNFPAVVQQQGEALLASLNTDATEQKRHIDEMLANVKSGDVRRGQALFNSEKTACSACHAIGYLGGKVGPDLTRIGQVRNERDLLEAIVYPSASFVRSYEPVIVATKSSEEFSGVLRKDAADEVVLATGPTTEQRISRNDIADMRPGTVSVMPSGLADQLNKQEIADLLAFLKATRW